MAEIEWINADGITITGKVPDFAMESTAIEMKDQLESINVSLKSVAAILTANAIREVKGQKETAEQHEEAMAASYELKDELGEMSNRDLDSAFAEKFLVGLVGAIETITVGVFGMLAGTATALGKSFLNVGGELNDLTKAGVGFTEGSMSATQALSSLSFRGVDAAKTLTQFSNVVQAVGKNTFTGLTTAFLDATDSGVQLGMSLDDSVERMGEELNKRQLMGALEGISQAKVTAQIETSIKQQQKYSSALGVSTDKLVEFAESIITQTPILSSALLRMGPELRSKVIAGVTDFSTAMRALGGEEGGKIAVAFTEAAAGGALGFSDAMVGYVQALPSLSGPMNEYIGAIQSGNLSQAQANQMAVDLTAQLGNISDAERARIFALERQGDQYAASIARAILQFEQGAEKLKEMNADFTMSDVQTGANTFSVAISEITGMFTALKYSFFSGLGDGTDELTDSLKAAKKTVLTAIGTVMNKLFGMGDGFTFVSSTATELGAKFAEKLPVMITTLASWTASVIEFIPTIVDAFKTIVGGVAIIAKVVGTIGLFGAALASVIAVIGIGGLIGGAAGGAARLVGGGGAVGGGAGMAGMAGMATGLRALANPQSLVGLAAVTAAILGISYAIKIAAPAVSEGIATIINAIKGDQEAMMKLQTDQIEVANAGIQSLASIPSDNLFNTADGIDAIAVSMKSFADTVIGKEGGFFSDVGGWFTGDSVDSTSQFVESMNAFAAIDGEQIAMNAAAIINANRAQAGMTTALDTNVVAARPTQRTAQSAAILPAQAAASKANSAANAMAGALPSSESTALAEILEQQKITNRLLRTGNKGMTDLSNAL